MHGLKHLSPVHRLVLDRKEPSYRDQVRMLLDDARELWVGWDYSYIVNEDEDAGVIEVVIRRAEHDCVPRALEQGLPHWFGVDARRQDGTLYIDTADLKQY